MPSGAPALCPPCPTFPGVGLRRRGQPGASAARREPPARAGAEAEAESSSPEAGWKRREQRRSQACRGPPGACGASPGFRQQLVRPRAGRFGNGTVGVGLEAPGGRLAEERGGRKEELRGEKLPS